MAEVKDIVIKGNLYHDWIISAITCVLEKDEQLIRRLFETQAYNAEGVYRLKLFVEGRWKHITVDDYIPCKPFG